MESFARFATDSLFTNTATIFSMNSAVNGVLTLYAGFTKTSTNQSIQVTDLTTPAITAAFVIAVPGDCRAPSQADFYADPVASVQFGTAITFKVQVQDFAGNNVGAGVRVYVTYGNSTSSSFTLYGKQQRPGYNQCGGRGFLHREQLQRHPD